MKMNRIQFQPGLSMPEFFERYGAESQCQAALQAALKAAALWEEVRERLEPISFALGCRTGSAVDALTRPA
jgi:ABC-type phosphate transport system ATPase subunit